VSRIRSQKSLSSIKALQREAATCTKEELSQPIGELLDEFSPEECTNYFRIAGYESE
jgi:hypothetical protein